MSRRLTSAPGSRGFSGSPAHAADGARTLAEAAAQVADFAAWLQEKATAGFELCEPAAGSSVRVVPGPAAVAARCLLGPECGLCLVRSGRAVPLDPWEWRRRLGPVTKADRLGHFRRERCDRVAKRGVQTVPTTGDPSCA